jgi:hypothetical protein
MENFCSSYVYIFLMQSELDQKVQELSTIGLSTDNAIIGLIPMAIISQSLKIGNVKLQNLYLHPSPRFVVSFRILQS